MTGEISQHLLISAYDAQSRDECSDTFISLLISFLIVYRNKRQKTIEDWNSGNDNQDASVSKVNRSTYSNAYQYYSSQKVNYI
jgi:hypothetical protein